MNKLIKQLVLCIACAPVGSWGSGVEDLKFYPSKEQQTKHITWLVVENPNRACHELAAKYQSPFASDLEVVACAVFVEGDKTCTIITGEFTSLATVGHEVRHCFEGLWHK
jgi:hypothetical protein